MTAIDTIRTVLNENLGIEPETITEETTFESLDIDSLDMTELVCALEDETGTELTELEEVKTVGQLAAKIESLSAPRPRPLPHAQTRSSTCKPA